MFTIFVEYSREKNMVDVIFFGSNIGSHQILNEGSWNKFSGLAALLLTSWKELSILSMKLFLSVFVFKMYVYTLMIRENFCFEKSSTLANAVASFKTFLSEWKWILIGLGGFIDQFWQNDFAPKSRYGGKMGRSLFLSWQWKPSALYSVCKQIIVLCSKDSYIIVSWYNFTFSHIKHSIRVAKMYVLLHKLILCW